MLIHAQIRNLIMLLLCSLAFTSISHSVFAGPADLDTGFADMGVMTLDLGLEEQATTLLLEPNPVGFRLIVAGRQCPLGKFDRCDFLVARVHQNAQLDHSFTSNGWTTASLGQDSNINAATLKEGGQILAVGGREEDELIGVDHDFALAQFTGLGRLDGTFNGTGKLATGFGDYERAYDVEIQANGKIVTVGSKSGSNYDFAIARYHADGSLDKSFDNDGKVIKGFGADDWALAVAVQADGKLVVVGKSGNKFIVARFQEDGRLDETFGNNGKVIAKWGIGEVYERANDVVIDTNGKIIVVGTVTQGGNNDFLIARLNTDGSFDSSFGQGGWMASDFDSRNDSAEDLMIDGSGRILVTGCSNQKFAVARYLSDGSLDKSFGVSGQSFSTIEACGSVAFAPDGRIFVTRSVDNGNNFDIQLVAFEGSSQESPFAVLVTDAFDSVLDKFPTSHADLSIQVDDMLDPIESGVELAYEIKIRNQGPSRAEQLVFEYQLPEGVILKEIVFPVGSCSLNNPIICTFSELDPAVMMTGTMLVEVSGVGAIENTMTIKSDVVDPDLANNTAIERTSITLPPAAPVPPLPPTPEFVDPVVIIPEAPSADGSGFSGENASAQRSQSGCSLIRG